jgi:hypothetical protein
MVCQEKITERKEFISLVGLAEYGGQRPWHSTPCVAEPVGQKWWNHLLPYP